MVRRMVSGGTPIRRQRVAQLIERFPLQDPAQFADPVADLACAGRFLLVEQSRYDARHFLSAHDSPEQAADYWETQEYPSDWEIVTLVDLDDGAEFEANQRIHFTPRQVQEVPVSTPEERSA
ncbi:MAG: hypothetical protein ABR540_18865 [Acidimicrobiales bacterium]